MRVLHERAPRSPQLCARPASPALDAGSVVAAAEAAAGAAAPLPAGLASTLGRGPLCSLRTCSPGVPAQPSRRAQGAGRRDSGGAPGARLCTSHLRPSRLPPRSRGAGTPLPAANQQCLDAAEVGGGRCSGGGGPSCLSRLQFLD